MKKINDVNAVEGTFEIHYSKREDAFGFDYLVCRVIKDDNTLACEVTCGLPERWHEWTNDGDWIGDWPQINIDNMQSVPYDYVVMCVALITRELIGLRAPSLSLTDLGDYSYEEMEEHNRILSSLLDTEDEENDDCLCNTFYCSQIPEAARNNVEKYILSRKDKYVVKFE